MIVETTAYGSWDSFRAVVQTAVEFMSERLSPDGYNRLGLRYLDEIQVPTAPDEEVDWEYYLNSTLPPPSPAGFKPQTWQSVAQYADDAERGLILRYGPQPIPIAIAGAAVGLQRRPPTEQGPCFIVDTDAFCQPSTIPRFDVQVILGEFESLHESISVLFESLVRPELRDLWS